jgi:hypothetical protein
MNLTLKGATVPEDAKVPGTLARFISLFEQVFSIEGADSIEGVIIQTTKPSPSDQGKAWVKITPGGSVEGWYTFSGGDWSPFPLVIPTVDGLPAIPQEGQFLLHGGAIKLYKDGSWTTNFSHSGATATRPDSPATNYLFFDTTIGRLLRWTGSAWTTADGCLGEIKLLVGVSEAEAITRNPGWAAYPLAGDRFLRIAGSTIGEGDKGGRESFDWKVSREYFEWGTGPNTDGNLGLDNINIDGNQGNLDVDSAGSSEPDSSNNWQDVHTVDTVPPFLGVTMIRKEVN